MNNKNNQNKEHQKFLTGFTFIELMVSISVMLILLLLSFPFYISINKQLAIDRAATRLVQDIRKAQELTMSAQKFSGAYPQGGYGIYFPPSAPDRYYLFADSNGDRLYSGTELVEQVDVEGRVSITNKTANFDNVTFKAPEPMVLLNDSSGADLAGIEAFVEFSDGSNSYQIYINKAGLIYIP